MPAVLYRRYRPVLAQARYMRHWPTRQVTPSGYVRWRGRLRVIGRAFGGERVGFKPVSAGVHEVYFECHLIGEVVDTDPGGMRPARWSQAPSTTSKA